MFPLLTQGVDMTTHSPETSPAVRAAIYTRISYDPAGQRAGVERQRLDCEALCLARGWEVVTYLEDNDRSAHSGKPRRAYQQLLRSIEASEIDAIVTWHNDRLHRSPRELEGFIDLVELTGVRVAVVSGGDYDLTTPDGRLAARIVGAVARKESEDRSRRVRRSTWSSPSGEGRPGSWGGACAAKTSGRWSGRPPNACLPATA
jgi:site-specific DNA recombinase